MGKSTLAQRLAAELNVFYLRIDTIEQGLADVCGIDVTVEGYALAHRLAADNLRLGLSVVTDSVNPLKITRDEWEAVAESVNVPFLNIEIGCSDMDTHRERVELRRSSMPAMTFPSWEAILNRQYEPWISDRLSIDTAHKTTDQSFSELLSLVLDR